MAVRPLPIFASLVGSLTLLALSTVTVIAAPEERVNTLIDAVQSARGQGTATLKGVAAGGGSDGGGGSSDGGGSNGGGSAGGDSDPEAQARAFFASDVHPLVFPRCYSACHEPAGVAAVSRLLLVGDTVANQVDRNYEVFKAFITSTGSAEILLARLSGSSHPGGTVYDTSSAQYATIEEFTRFF